MPASYPASTDFALRLLRPGDEEALLAIFAATRGHEWEVFVRQQFAAQHAQYMRGYANPHIQPRTARRAATQQHAALSGVEPVHLPEWGISRQALSLPFFA